MPHGTPYLLFTLIIFRAAFQQTEHLLKGSQNTLSCADTEKRDLMKEILSSQLSLHPKA